MVREQPSLVPSCEASPRALGSMWNVADVTLVQAGDKGPGHAAVSSNVWEKSVCTSILFK